MSAIESVCDRYRTFGDQQYVPLVKGVELSSLLAALPTIIEINVAEMELTALLDLRVFILTVIYAYTTQAWNIMSGYTEQFSFGHTTFFGAGAYTTQILVVDFTVSPWVGVLVGSVVATGYGLATGALSFRFNLQGHCFALATLAFAGLFRFAVTNMSGLHGASGYFEPFSRDHGAEYGFVVFQFQNDLPYCYLVVGFLLVMALISQVIKNSWVGLYSFAIREDERAAASVGMPDFRYRLIGIATSAFFTALGSAYWLMCFNTIRLDTMFMLFRNVGLLLPVVVGSPGTLLDPIVGSLIVAPAGEIMRTTFSDISGFDHIIYGTSPVAIITYSLRGVVDWPSQACALWTRVRGGEEVSK